MRDVLTGQERNGRLFLQCLFALWIMAELLLITLSVAKQGASELIFGGVRLALTVGLMYLVMRGKSWARWLFVALLLVTLVLVGFSLLQQPNPIMYCLTLYLGLLLYALLFSASVKAYLHPRRLTHLTIIVAAALIATVPTASAETRAAEHAWVLDWRGNYYGLVQWDDSDDGDSRSKQKRTVIYLGAGDLSVNQPAILVAGVGLFGLLSLVLIPLAIGTRIRKR